MLDQLVVGNERPLMLVCSNVRIFGRFTIFSNAFNAAFWDFPQVQNPYKRLQGDGFFYATCWF